MKRDNIDGIDEWLDRYFDVVQREMTRESRRNAIDNLVGQNVITKYLHRALPCTVLKNEIFDETDNWMGELRGNYALCFEVEDCTVFMLLNIYRVTIGGKWYLIE